MIAAMFDSPVQTLTRLRPAGRVGLVLGGYLAALVAAVVTTWLHAQLLTAPDHDGSSGMAAFGDMLLFLAVAALASVPPTVLALWYLRSVQWFWWVVGAVSAAFAATAFPALISHFDAQSLPPGHPLASMSAVWSLRLVLAPLPAFANALAALMAPGWRFRALFLGTMAVEALAFFGLLAAALSSLR